ncbi:hypothetical protein EDB85DRAFT_2186408 [Lactarius pseudohatsudake]|nr:hypothetical protein EDB85DRAFT_2186408 [Lactarius pseudohatsudake]
MFFPVYLTMTTRSPLCCLMSSHGVIPWKIEGFSHTPTTAPVAAWALQIAQSTLRSDIEELAKKLHGLHFDAMAATAEQIESAFMPRLADKMRRVAPYLWSLVFTLLGATDGRRSSLTVDPVSMDLAEIFDESEQNLGEIGGDSDVEDGHGEHGDDSESDPEPEEDVPRRKRSRKDIPSRNTAIRVISILGIFVHSANVPQRVAEVLAHAGLTISIKSIQRAVKSMSIDSARKIKTGLRSLKMAIAYDNFDINFKTSEPTLTHQSSFVSATSATAVPLVGVDNIDALRCSEALWAVDPRNPSSSVSRAGFDEFDLLKFHVTDTYNWPPPGTEFSPRQKAFAWHDTSARTFGQVGVGCLTRCLKSYNLPVSLSGPRITGLPASRLLTVDRLLGIMNIGKKNSGSEKKIVLLATIGKTVEQKASVVPHPIIAKTLAEAAEVIPGVNGSQIQYLESECCLPLSTRSNLMASRLMWFAKPIRHLVVSWTSTPFRRQCNPSDYSIESSSATYPQALAIAAITGTTCTISNIGSSSLRGDVRFAKEVFGPMGCKGPPKGQLKALGLIDMEPMTDAFLTASVPAAVAAGTLAKGRELDDGSKPTTTRIVGIANQRVKECNRIRAMIDQLAKFGVETKELDDGFEVYGKPIGDLKRGVSVHCYHYHRIAMAFRPVVDKMVLKEKRCVEKTWPNCDLENMVNIFPVVVGVELGQATDHASAKPDEAPSVIIIGIRGSGKTHWGISYYDTGLSLHRRGRLLRTKIHSGLRDYVQQHGWPAFRTTEIQVFKEPPQKFPSHHVIGLGRGNVETPEAREILSSYAKDRLVDHAVRPVHKIVAYLEAESNWPADGEPIIDVYRWREARFTECSSYEFISSTVVPTPDERSPPKVNNVRDEVAHFFSHVIGHKANLAPDFVRGHRSYFLSLTFPDITPSLSNFEELTAGVDAVELCLDLLCHQGQLDSVGPHIPPLSYVSEQVTAIRRVLSLPIVYTVRTLSQGGAFPDKSVKEAFDLFRLALRLGVENLKWDLSAVDATLEVAKAYGDVVKIVGKANPLDNNLALQRFVKWENSAVDAKPITAINMGVDGQLSRVLNHTCTPVTHPLFPSKAAPGQMSFVEIQTLNPIGEPPARKFYIFGNPVAHSHVTFHLSPEAKAIGAINTIISRTKGGSQILFGDNTDWIGIRNVVRDRLPSSMHKIDSALVIGMGGTVRVEIYALHSLGATRTYLSNRTRRSAEELVNAIPGACVALLNTLDLSSVPGAVAPSIIVFIVRRRRRGEEAGVVVDMAYKPTKTPLLKLVKTAVPVDRM